MNPKYLTDEKLTIYISKTYDNNNENYLCSKLFKMQINFLKKNIDR